MYLLQALGSKRYLRGCYERWCALIVHTYIHVDFSQNRTTRQSGVCRVWTLHWFVGKGTRLQPLLCVTCVDMAGPPGNPVHVVGYTGYSLTSKCTGIVGQAFKIGMLIMLCEIDTVHSDVQYTQRGQNLMWSTTMYTAHRDITLFPDLLPSFSGHTKWSGRPAIPSWA